MRLDNPPRTPARATPRQIPARRREPRPLPSPNCANLTHTRAPAQNEATPMSQKVPKCPQFQNAFDIHPHPPQPTPMLNTVLQQIDANRQQSLEGLKTFLRIPSVSTKPEHQPDMQRCAQYVADQVAACGLAV